MTIMIEPKFRGCGEEKEKKSKKKKTKMKIPKSILKGNRGEKEYWLYRKDKRRWVFLCRSTRLDTIKKALKEYSFKKGDSLITLRTVKITEKLICHN